MGLASVATSSAPPLDRTVQDWAAQERIVSRVESKLTGPWLHSRFPVAVEIMDACSLRDPSTIIAIRGSAQTIKSEIAKNTIGSFITDNPRGILCILPSNDEVTKYERTKLEPMFKATDCLARRVYGVGKTSDPKSTVKLKMFKDGSITLTAAGTSKGLQMITVGLIIAEEVSEYPPDTGGRGFALDQGIERGTQYEGELKVVVPATPGIKGKCKITELFEAGSQAWIFWKCGHCGDHYRLQFKHMDEVDGRAVIFAPCCGVKTEQSARREMNRTARFVHCFKSLNPANAVPWASFEKKGEEPHILKDVIRAKDFKAALNRDLEGRDKSFHIWRGQSPFSLWAGVWKKWKQVKGNPIKLKVFYQQYLGLPYESAVDVPSHAKLMKIKGGAPNAKTSPVRRGIIPPWAGFVTMAADLQGDRFEWSATAWGPGPMSAVIDHGVINTPPLHAEGWRELRKVFGTEWPSVHLRNQIAVKYGIDTGGHNTQQAYQFIKANPDVLGIKGMTGPRARFEPLLQPSKRGGRLKYGGRTIARVPFWLLNTHLMKKVIYAGLDNALLSAETGKVAPGYHLFFHGDVGEEWCKQITAEHLIVDPMRDLEKWEKITESRANEQLDLAVYNYAMALQYGLEKMSDTDWQTLFAREIIDATKVDMGPLEMLMSDTGVQPLPRPSAQDSEAPDWLKRLHNLNKRSGQS